MKKKSIKIGWKSIIIALLLGTIAIFSACPQINLDDFLNGKVGVFDEDKWDNCVFGP